MLECLESALCCCRIRCDWNGISTTATASPARSPTPGCRGRGRFSELHDPQQHDIFEAPNDAGSGVDLPWSGFWTATYMKRSKTRCHSWKRRALVKFSRLACGPPFRRKSCSKTLTKMLWYGTRQDFARSLLHGIILCVTQPTLLSWSGKTTPSLTRVATFRFCTAHAQHSLRWNSSTKRSRAWSSSRQQYRVLLSARFCVDVCGKQGRRTLCSRFPALGSHSLCLNAKTLSRVISWEQDPVTKEDLATGVKVSWKPFFLASQPHWHASAASSASCESYRRPVAVDLGNVCRVESYISCRCRRASQRESSRIPLGRLLGTSPVRRYACTVLLQARFGSSRRVCR